MGHANWPDLNLKPYDKRQVHPYSRTRGVLANDVEIEAVKKAIKLADRLPEASAERWRSGWSCS
jgi:hypothetical protein